MRLLGMALLALSLPACYQKMAVQPSLRPLQSSDFFADGRASRPTVSGTVARGQLGRYTDTALYHGKDDKGNEVTDFPFEVTKRVLDRGRQRFEVFCAVCHGYTGAGDGRVVKRGFTVPPNLNTEASRLIKIRTGKEVPLTEVSVGHLYDVVTRGFGAMPDYSEQIPVNDRWAIVAYVRALQYARSPALREKLGKEKAK